MFRSNNYYRSEKLLSLTRVAVFGGIDDVAPVESEQVGGANSALGVVDFATIGNAQPHLLANILNHEIILWDVLERFKSGLKLFKGKKN